MYTKAATEQWGEWKKLGSVEILSIAESDLARRNNPKDRFLPSRFVYRDKNAGMRSEQLSLPVKAKARLFCGDHRDPDLTTGQLRTDAPMVMRTSVHLFFVFAFMQGEAQARERVLFMEQAREGLPGMQPG